MRTPRWSAPGLLVIVGFASACGGGTGPVGRQSLPPPANAYYSSLTAIWAFSGQDVWAVGDRVLHYDGQRWSEVAGPGGGTIVPGALWGLAPDDLWTTAGSQIFRWRGQSTGWVELVHGIPNAPEFNSVWALSEDDYAAGGGVVNWEIVRSKAGATTRAYTHGATMGIWGANSDDVWAAAEDGGFWHWTGSSWSSVEPASGGGGYPQSVWGFATDDVWAAGERGTLEHWDGVVWTATTLEDAELRAVWGAASDDVWAVGEGGAIWHFDGKTWRARGSAGPAIFFTGISGSGPDSVWAVGYELGSSGNHGVVYRVR
jgi:hypothetical protein